MKNCVNKNVSKPREIKGSDKYITLEISLKFDSLENMRITSSDTKDNLGRSGNGLITSLGLKPKASPKKYRKETYDIVSVRKKGFSKIIWDFD